ncbi:uncharacterized protein LOC119071938 isoform X2 [Bradysia coprophila]|uniref:uncharacterized protein LOC119071938 isoform X1 n=1 Tax=Bradysia coprophila TaxID=38358 RepID=UPI00187DB801|nr:uncharacterized protein LOC119071938 isoform X1 [Bradysia coprophila]XP_037032957.1 uncharacterized protein LOC119071938 isoform X2 [Bradysia coprophila]
MNHSWLSILFICGVIYNTCALSIDCGEFYDDETISRTWGYVYYSCNGTVMTTDNNQTLELFGFHLYGRNSSYTERFALNNQNLTSFPTSFEKFFPFLQIIDFSFNYIESMTNTHLQPHKRLSSLLLEHNRISTLDSNLFNGLDELINVRLNDNNIKHVGYDIKLPQYVHMDNNPCTPTCCDLIKYFMNITTSEYLRNQCPPLQSTIENSVDFPHDVEISNAVDNTQEKDEAPATEEPSIETKLPKMGEMIQCAFKVTLRENDDESLGKRCSELARRHPDLFRVFDNPEMRSRLKDEIEMREKAAEATNEENVTPAP